MNLRTVFEVKKGVSLRARERSAVVQRHNWAYGAKTCHASIGVQESLFSRHELALSELGGCNNACD